MDTLNEGSKAEMLGEFQLHGPVLDAQSESSYHLYLYVSFCHVIPHPSNTLFMIIIIYYFIFCYMLYSKYFKIINKLNFWL